MKPLTNKDTCFADMILTILSEDAYTLETAIRRFSKNKEIVDYGKLLYALIKKYKGTPPEPVPFLKSDYKEAVRLNRHFGANRICIKQWGAQVLPADEYEQILEKYEWIKIVFYNLVIDLKNEADA